MRRIKSPQGLLSVDVRDLCDSAWLGSGEKKKQNKTKTKTKKKKTRDRRGFRREKRKGWERGGIKGREIKKRREKRKNDWTMDRRIERLVNREGREM